MWHAAAHCGSRKHANQRAWAEQAQQAQQARDHWQAHDHWAARVEEPWDGVRPAVRPDGPVVNPVRREILPLPGDDPFPPYLTRTEKDDVRQMMTAFPEVESLTIQACVDILTGTGGNVTQALDRLTRMYPIPPRE
jgi:hypothetical protein